MDNPQILILTLLKPRLWNFFQNNGKISSIRYEIVTAQKCNKVSIFDKHRSECFLTNWTPLVSPHNLAPPHF